MPPELYSIMASVNALYIVGAIASIISIPINIVQLLVNRSLKRERESLKRERETIVCIGENALANVERDSNAALADHPANQTEHLKAILAHAETGKNSLSQVRRKQLSLPSRK